MTKIADLINGKIADFVIEYRIHASQKMFRRDIHEDDVETVLKNGEIIERYDEDFPLPSLLINGRTSEKRPLHVVAAINCTEKIIVIITAYEPDKSRWTSGFSGRIK
ncbi:MAG: DUF4258 domain-containing protein [Desulfococcaceae bacterium]